MPRANPREQHTTLEVTKGTAARFRMSKLRMCARAGRTLSSDEVLSGLLDLLDAWETQQPEARKAAG